MTGIAAWVLAVDAAGAGAGVRAARPAAGHVTVLAVGGREVADAASTAGADRVLWASCAPDVPVEAAAPRVAAAVAEAAPRLLVAGDGPAARVLLGAAAARAGAAVVGGVTDVRADGERLVVDRLALDGAVVQTLAADGVLAVQVVGGDAPADAAPAGAVAVEELPADGEPPAARVSRRAASGGGNGLHDAERVVSVGRGLRARADLALVEELAGAIGAEVGCTMPVADDLGWVPKERYVGRSGQQIAPRLYLALGVSGMPQHMEGVRGARVVAAVNSDPEAPIFRSADYGVVGDLYEVVPALLAALRA